MKKILFFTLLTTLFLSFSFEADAQYRGKKKKKKKKSSTKSEYFDDKGNIASRLWYGADVSVGFGSDGFNANVVDPATGGIINDRFSGNVLFLGISPMVGYKITDNFSVGPKLGISYQNRKYSGQFSTEEITLRATDYSVGVISRLKFLQTYFLHGEVENVWEERPTGVIDNDNKFETDRTGNLHYYLGAGYSSGGELGFNVYFLWDFSRQFSANDIPIVSRLGLTYRF